MGVLDDAQKREVWKLLPQRRRAADATTRRTRDEVSSTSGSIRSRRSRTSRSSACREALQGLTYSVGYRPVLFGALLKHWGHKGPAEIEPKRAWTYRHVLWLAHRHGIAMQMPAQHPFNPLALLRLLHGLRARRAARRTGMPASRCCTMSGRAAAMPTTGSPRGA